MISNPQQLINQQLGIRNWKSYNCILERLHCIEDHNFGEPSTEPNEMDCTPIFACKFAEKQGYEECLALANEDGQLMVRNTETNQVLDSKQIHNNAIFDITWLSDALKVLTVSGDHTARLVNVEDNMQVEQIFVGHTGSVKTVATRKMDSSVFATGSRDGSIRVWDTRCTMAANLILGADRTIENCHCRSNTATPSSSRKGGTPSSSYGGITGANSVTGLVFQNMETLISCSSGDGLIKVWDLRKTYIHSKSAVSKFTIPYFGSTTRNGFSNLLIDPCGLKLYASCLDNTIYAYNVGTYNTTPVMEYKGHQNSTFYVKSALSKDGQYLLSGSSDQNAYIWNLKQKYPLVRLQGHTAEVTCVAWRQKGDITLVTCADDVKHKIWRIRGEEDYSDVTVYGNAEVATRKSVLGSPTRTSKRKYFNENTPVHRKVMKIENRKRSSTSSNSSDLSEYSPGSFSSSRRLFERNNEFNEHDLSAIAEEDADSIRTSADLDAINSFSPTTNLPNYVLDGVAPHLNHSPQKRPDKDWLTKMRYEKSLFRELNNEINEYGSRNKVPRLEDMSPRSRKTPTSSRKRKNASSEERCSSPDLRKFFRITNNSILKDTQCSPRNLINIESPKAVKP